MSDQTGQTTATQIASYAIAPSTGPTASSLGIETSQAHHRLRLLASWSSISPGSRILELGCGQGTCTAVLAHAVGSQGHVDAVDPAPLGYGAPFTLEQAQSHLLSTEIGSRMTFHRADPVGFLASEENKEKTWDAAVLAHCIWYFPSPQILLDILTSLKGRVKRVCVAEYALQATERDATGHVLATFARGTLEAHKGESESNIQTALSPGQIKEVVAKAGWTVEEEGVVVPEMELSDGRWETGDVLSKGFTHEVETIRDERVKAVLRGMRDAVQAEVGRVGGVKGVRTMDVWVATLVECDE